MRLKKPAVRGQQHTVFCVPFEAIAEAFDIAVSHCFVVRKRVVP